MLKLARLGAVIFPPVPAFYNRPEGIADLVDHTVMRMLDQLGIETGIAPRWGE
jgi:4-hydroxy-3-polyprenylbenzoate decarboxylase